MCTDSAIFDVTYFFAPNETVSSTFHTFVRLFFGSLARSIITTGESQWSGYLIRSGLAQRDTGLLKPRGNEISLGMYAFH